MPTPRSAWIWLDLSPDIAVANTDEIIIKAVPVAGTIKSVSIAINTLLGAGGGTLALAKGAANVLSSATYNIGATDLVAATPEFATLTTAGSTLVVAAGDLLKATWTMTTAAVTNAASLLVAIEPAEW
jgi:hypothetical protein